MKLKKWVQVVLSIIFIISLTIILLTIDSEWTSEYQVILICNAVAMVCSGILLVKFGRWE